MRRREFRSDTMTMPTQAMRDAMRDAEVGDDVCNEDPTVNRLQEIAARKIGKESSLFVPSGTFGNQCAIAVHTRPGYEIIVLESAHVVQHEAGASAALSGVQVRVVTPGNATFPTIEDIEPRIRVGGDIHYPRTGLIVLENALSDGTVMPVDAMRSVKDLAAKHGIPVHLDGARIFNAAVALGVDAAEIASQADTVSICLSKGLGAPVGSLLCGSFEFIDKARKRRKMMGGAMRQVGVLAAPGVIALSEGVARLAEDHRNAKLLADLLDGIPGVVVEPDKVQTNIVFCAVEKPGRSDAELVDFLIRKEIITYPPEQWGIRLVTSREVDGDDVRALAAAVAEYLA